MSSLTSLTPLPYPDPSDQPFVHLDIRALAEATAEALPVVTAERPPHRPGRTWLPNNGRAYRSNGELWAPVDGPLAGGTTIAGPAVPAGTQLEHLIWTVSATLNATTAPGGVFTLPWPTAALSGPITSVAGATAHLWWPGTAGSAEDVSLQRGADNGIGGAGLIFTNAAREVLTTGGPFLVTVAAGFVVTV